MRLRRPSRKSLTLSCALLLLAGLMMLTGCKGIPKQSEIKAREDLRTVTKEFRPEGKRPELPTLNTNAPLDDFLRYAMLNQPQVEAAYYEWAAAVERITRERSLPDPRLTFESDIADMVSSVMPGLMMEFPGPGKLRLRANVAAQEAQMKYFAFETAALESAASLKRAYYQLHFLDEKIRITRQTSQLVEELELIARKQQEVGKVTLQDVLRAQIEESRLQTELANLDDSRNPLLAQFKGALGLRAEDTNPPITTRFETTPLDLNAERLLATAFARNPRLKAMEAEVRRASGSLALAYKARVPDYSVGAEVDVKANPVMVTPQLGVTLPIWRDKIAAEIAEAQAMKRAADARLTAEQIMVAIDLAEKTFMYREATRNLALYRDALLPKARLSLEVARSSYLTGRIDFFNLIDAWRTLLSFEISEIEARTQRELLLTDLSLLIAGVPPARAPFLSTQAQTISNSKESHAK